VWYRRAVEKTTLYLSAELQLALRALARRTGRSQAVLIREALERYVAGADVPRPRSIGAAADGTLGAPEAKRWVRERWAAEDRSRTT
jgi:predicted transcriptional regulator